MKNLLNTVVNSAGRSISPYKIMELVFREPFPLGINLKQVAKWNIEMVLLAKYGIRNACATLFRVFLCLMCLMRFDALHKH